MKILAKGLKRNKTNKMKRRKKNLSGAGWVDAGVSAKWVDEGESLCGAGRGALKFYGLKQNPPAPALHRTTCHP